MRTITLPEAITVTSRGQSVVVELAKLSDAILAELCAYGLTQKLGDSGSQAASIALESAGKADDGVEARKLWVKGEGAQAVGEVTQNLMLKTRDALYAGQWAQRVSGAGVDDETRVARGIVRQAFKDKVGAKGPQWAQFTGLEPQAQLAKLDQWYGENKAAFDPAVKAELKRRADEAQAKAKLAQATEFAF